MQVPRNLNVTEAVKVPGKPSLQYRGRTIHSSKSEKLALSERKLQIPGGPKCPNLEYLGFRNQEPIYNTCKYNIDLYICIYIYK